ncbi:hypothetical protein KKF84_21005 [Myxococcota bacterium]|nr:hypothetical protein [Myxococcota bacterium]MBU1537805.1 hypothetical protein [Myxococcota bacterium]
MAEEKKKAEPPAGKAIRIRSLGDVNAAINAVIDRSSAISGLSVMAEGIFRADFTVGVATKKSVLAPSKTFSMFFVPDSMTERAFIKRFIAKTGKLKETHLKKAEKEGIWNYFFPETEDHVHFGMTGALPFGNMNVYFFSLSPTRSDVIKSVSAFIKGLKNNTLSDNFYEESDQLRSRWIGPGVVAGVLAIEALILLFSSAPVYRFGRGTDAGLPNLAAALFFLTMGGLALIRRFRITYLFLLLTEMATIANIIVVGILAQKLHLSFTVQNFGITLLHLFLLVFIPIRGQDFNVFSLRQFYKRVLFGFRDWSHM